MIRVISARFSSALRWKQMGLTEIVIAIVLVVLLIALTLLMNPPSSWIK